MPKKKLPFLVTNYQVSLWPLCVLAEMLIYHFHKVFKVSYFGPKIGEWDNRTNRWAIDPQTHDKVAQVMLKKVEKNPAWAWKTAKKIPIVCQEFLKFTNKEIFRADLKKKTDKELYNLYMKYRQQFINTYIYCWFPNAPEGLNNIFTKKLQKCLEKKLGKKGQVGKYLSVLTTPTKDSMRQKEEKEFLSIMVGISKNKKIQVLFKKDLVTIKRDLPKVESEIARLLKRHYNRFCWLQFDYDGPAWDKDYVLDRARSYVKQGIDPKKQLWQMVQERKKLKALQNKFANKLGSGSMCLFKLAQELMYLKDFRKDAIFQSYYHVDHLIQEIARRLALTPIQVKYILPQEMQKALLKKDYDEHELNERIKYSVLVYDEKGVQVFTGQKAKAIVKQRVKQDKVKKNIKQLKGECAYSGKVKGIVRLVFEIKDMNKMRQGDILVSVATNPNLLPAMRKAGAIITDKGGITSHAAIISRELKIPCVTGTEIASKVLKDGDKVEVDANAGTCKIL